jgi:hypothetical protein
MGESIKMPPIPSRHHSRLLSNDKIASIATQLIFQWRTNHLGKREVGKRGVAACCLFRKRAGSQYAAQF